MNNYKEEYLGTLRRVRVKISKIMYRLFSKMTEE